MGDSLEPAADASVEAQNVAIVEFGAFANYLRKAATILLPEEDAVPPGLNVALEDRGNQDCINKFLSDPQVPALYIQRSCTKGESLEIEGIRPIDDVIFHSVSLPRVVQSPVFSQSLTFMSFQ